MCLDGEWHVPESNHLNFLKLCLANTRSISHGKVYHLNSLRSLSSRFVLSPPSPVSITVKSVRFSKAVN